MAPAERSAADDAVQRLEHLLRDRPHELHAPLTAAVREVVRMRDAAILRQRAGDATARAVLRSANQLVSIAISAQFPVSGTHWDRIGKLRDGLQELLATTDGDRVHEAG